MTTATYVNALRNHHVLADLQRRSTVEPGPLSDPAVRADAQEPWVFDINRGFDNHAVPNVSPEGSQNPAFEFVSGEKGIQKNDRIDQQPGPAYKDPAPSLVVTPWQPSAGTEKT
jgi:hypothetical protein